VSDHIPLAGKAVARRLLEIRSSLGIPRDYAACALNMSYSHFAKYELGTASINLENLNKLAKFYKVSPLAFYDWAETDENSAPWLRSLVKDQDTRDILCAYSQIKNAKTQQKILFLVQIAATIPKPCGERQSEQGDSIVMRAKAYVEANIKDRTLDPSRLATAIGISLRRLQELFAERDLNIASYIWQCRLEVAAKLLEAPGSGHLSLGSVAESCGFADQAHFSRRFKALHGMTPSEYRATLIVQTQ
jgi:AraC-like DNA-binding protein